jgi:hypothetical protein
MPDKPTPPTPRTDKPHRWIGPLSSAFDQKYNPAPTPTKVAYKLTRQITVVFRGGNSRTIPKTALLTFDLAPIVTVNQGAGQWSYFDMDEIVALDNRVNDSAPRTQI